jgi:O-Antigen ligase
VARCRRNSAIVWRPTSRPRARVSGRHRDNLPKYRGISLTRGRDFHSEVARKGPLAWSGASCNEPAGTRRYSLRILRDGRNIRGRGRRLAVSKSGRRGNQSAGDQSEDRAPSLRLAGRPQLASHLVTTAIVATTLVVLSFRGGFYGTEQRSALAICLWFAIVLVAVAAARIPRLPGLAVVCLSAFGALAVWTALSATWAASDEAVAAEFTRVLLYLGVFTLAAVLITAGTATAVADGAAAGIAIVGVVALSSRLFPGSFHGINLAPFLPGAETRLSYPIGYWNAVGVLIAMGLPFLLRRAAAPGPVLLRGLAVAPLPALFGAGYLTSSRGAVAAAVAGILVFLLVSETRWGAGFACALGFGGGLLVVHALRVRPLLTDGPFNTSEAAAEGHRVAVLTLIACIVAGGGYALGARVVPKSARVPRRLNWAVAAVLGITLVVGVVFLHPIRRFDAFKQPEREAAQNDASQTTVSGHLFSESGSGRWQIWTTAVDEWKTNTCCGRGAGSFGSWWLEHGTLAKFTRSAHSVYLQMLGELGIVGLALLTTAFGAGVVALVTRARNQVMRSALSAAGGSFAAYAVAAGIDWMWQVTVVSVLGIACLGVLTGRATARVQHPVASAGRTPLNIALRVGVASVATAVIVVEAIPALADGRLRSSQEAAARGDLISAYADAQAARAIEPWAASSTTQLALIAEQGSNLKLADRWIHTALARDPRSWTIWLTAARIETKRGEIARARRSLARARKLNPHSPVFATGPRP